MAGRSGDDHSANPGTNRTPYTNSAKSQQSILSSNRALDTAEKGKVVTIAWNHSKDMHDKPSHDLFWKESLLSRQQCLDQDDESGSLHALKQFALHASCIMQPIP